MPQDPVTIPLPRLRICLPTGIFPPDIGGPASYVPRIATALTERGHSVEVITLADDARAPLPEYPFPVRRIPRGMPRLLRMDATVHEIVRAAWRADLIFANGLFIEAAAAAAVARRPLAMKIVGDWAWERAMNQRVGDRDMVDFQTRRQPVKFEIVKWIRSVVSRRADRIIAASRFFAGQIAAWGVASERLVIIPNAIQPAPDPLPAGIPAFPGRTLIVVARLIPFKKIDDLLLLISRRNDWRLVIVGDGPERGNLEDLTIRLAASDRVVFTGAVPPGRILGLMQASQLMLINSSNETFSYITLEAFSAGIPVVAVAAGSLPELIADGQNGLLVPPGDPVAMDQAAQRVLSDPHLSRALVEGGLTTLAARYRWDDVVTQTERVLSGMAETRRKPT